MKDPFEVAFNRTTETVRDRSLPPPERLLHFTDYEGLLGILENRVLWLSRARSLNDSLEIQHGLNIASRVIDEAARNSPHELESEILQEAKRMVAEGYSELRDAGLPFIDAHVAAFSGTEARDSLLHWALYGRGGDGFAIVFDVSNVPRAPDGPDLFRVEYGEEAQAQEMKTALDRFLRAARTSTGQDHLANRRVRPGYVGSLCGLALTNLAAAMKHSNFRSEGEWRLVASWASSADKGKLDLQLKFRHSRRTITPYYELPIGPDAIVEVIMGSKVNTTLNRPAVERLLQDRKFTKARVSSTSLSLR